DAHAVTRSAGEQVELARAVDEQLRRDRTFEGERGSLASWRYHDVRPSGLTISDQRVRTRCTDAATGPAPWRGSAARLARVERVGGGGGRAGGPERDARRDADADVHEVGVEEHALVRRARDPG